MEDRLINRLKEAETRIVYDVTHGNGIKDYSDYRYALGRIKGLTDALEISEEIFKRNIKNDA